MLNPICNKFPIPSSCCFLSPNTDASQGSLAKPTLSAKEMNILLLCFFLQKCGHAHVDLHHALLTLSSIRKQQISDTI